MVTSTFTRSKLKPTPLLQIYSFYTLYCLSLRQLLSSSCPGQKLCSNSSFFPFLLYSTSNQLAYTVGFLFQIYQNFYYVLPSLRLSSENIPKNYDLLLYFFFFFFFCYSFQMMSVLLSWSTFNLLNIAARMILLRLGQILWSLLSAFQLFSISLREETKVLTMACKAFRGFTSVPVWLISYYQLHSSLFFEHDRHISASKPLHPTVLSAWRARSPHVHWLPQDLQVLMPIALAHKDLIYPLPKTRLRAVLSIVPDLSP